MSVYSSAELTSSGVETTTSHIDLLSLLIEGIGAHAVEEDPEELERFQERVNAEATRLKQGAEASGLKPAVEAVVQVMAEHNKTVKAGHKAHAAELTKALRMMTETIGFVGKTSQAAVHQLAVIEKNLEEVTASNDARSLRMKLGVCLKMIRDQSESLQAQSNEHLSQLKAFVASSSIAAQDIILLEEPVDGVTGLPGRAFAENLMREKLSEKTDCLVGVVRINRFNNFSSRYGETAVNDVVRTAARLLAQRLPAGTTLCRWSQNAFIALTEIGSSYAETSQQWRKVGNLKLEKSIDEGARAAYVVLTTSFMLEHLRPSTSKRELVQNVERFAAQQSGDLAA